MCLVYFDHVHYLLSCSIESLLLKESSLSLFLTVVFVWGFVFCDTLSLIRVTYISMDWGIFTGEWLSWGYHKYKSEGILTVAMPLMKMIFPPPSVTINCH